MVTEPPASFSEFTIFVWPTRAHSCRIWRRGTLSAMSVTLPFCIVSFRSPAEAGADRPAARAARSAQRRMFFIDVWLAVSIRLLGRSGERGSLPSRGSAATGLSRRLCELHNPERRVFAREIARPAHVGSAALQVRPPGVAVGLRVPDL